jgi:hypothetical protein
MWAIYLKSLHHATTSEKERRGSNGFESAHACFLVAADHRWLLDLAFTRSLLQLLLEDPRRAPLVHSLCELVSREIATHTEPHTWAVYLAKDGIKQHMLEIEKQLETQDK